jgi:hypothetical protein
MDCPYSQPTAACFRLDPSLPLSGFSIISPSCEPTTAGNGFSAQARYLIDQLNGTSWFFADANLSMVTAYVSGWMRERLSCGEVDSRNS